MKSLLIALLFIPFFAFAGEKHPLTGMANEDFIHAMTYTTIKGPLQNDEQFHVMNFEVMLIFESKDHGKLAAHEYIAFGLEPKSVTETPDKAVFVEHELMISGKLLNDSAEKVVKLAKDWGYTGEENARVVLVTGMIGAAPEMIEVTEKGRVKKNFETSGGGTNFKMEYIFTYVPEDEFMDYTDYCHSPWRCNIIQ